MSSLSGKVIAITGAASGIGLATAHYLASLGACLSLADINGTLLDAAAKSIHASSPDADIHTRSVNVTSSRDVDAWIDEIIQRFGHLDGAANMAGIFSTAGKTIEELSDGDFDAVMDVNVKGMFYCLRAQLRVMGMGQKKEGGEVRVGNGGGSIVNAASVAGLIGAERNAPYGVSKHAVIGLTRCAAKEVGSRGIRVNCIAPGPIETPMIAGVDLTAPERRARMLLGRSGKPEEVARVIAFLLGDDSSYITGCVQTIDGGWSC